MDLGLMAIVASGLLTVVLGFIWYHPSVFGNVSGGASQLSETASGRRNVFVVAIFGFLSAMLVAYVMSYVSVAWGFYDYTGAFKLGIWCWLGFVAPVSMVSVLFEQRPLKSFFVHASFWLIAMLLMSQMLVWAAAATYSPYSTMIESTSYVGE